MAKRITIKSYEKNGRIIEVNIPVNLLLFTDAINILRNEPLKKFDNDTSELDNSPKISSALVRLDEFRVAMTEMRKKYGSWLHIVKEIENTVNLEQRDDKMISSRIQNKKKVNEFIKEIQHNVDLSTTKAAIIHISSCLSDEEKANILDNISLGLSPIEIRGFKTDRKNNHNSIIEILLFASNMQLDSNIS